MASSEGLTDIVWKRQLCPSGTYYSNGYCYSNSSWYYWGRWVLTGVIIFVFILLFACLGCINARRRRRRGLAPYYGTGWMANRPYGGGGGWPAQREYDNAPPPQYSQNPAQNQYTGTTFQSGDGYYGRHDNIPLQQPQTAYNMRGGGGAYAAPPVPAPEPPLKPAPTFSSDKVTVLFVLGGPGAGKGTQCERLVKQYGFTHLSAGDLLRAEQDRPGSQVGQLIKSCIKDGKIVPMEVTVQLLEDAMTPVVAKDPEEKGKFLVDGFPRQMDQAYRFEDSVCKAQFVLFYDCPEKEMERRLLERGKTSGRTDDNEESIRKRFRTFIETSMPVVDYFERDGRVVKIDATASPDVVFEHTKEKLESRLGSSLSS